MPGQYPIAIIAAALLLGPAAAAAGYHGQAGNAPYFGFALGFPSADRECDYHGYDCDGSDESFKFYGGLRFHDNLAVELSYQDLGKIRDREDGLTTTAESDGVNLSLHGIIPVEGIGYFYGKIGYMLWDTEYTRIGVSRSVSDDDGEELTYGLGFAFLFGGRYDFRVEYERLNELGDEFVPGGDHITVFSFGGTIYLY